MTVSTDKIVETLVGEAERLLPVTFPPEKYPGMSWHLPRWEYQPADVAKVRSTGVRFTSHPKDGGQPFHPVFEYTLKAYLIHQDVKSSKASSVVSGARGLWSVLLKNGIDTRTFRWEFVTQPVLNEVEDRLLNHFGLSSNSAVIYSGGLQNFLEWLQIEGVLPGGLELKRTLRLKTPMTLSSEDKKAREDRMVSRAVLDALADFYNTAKRPDERLVICAVGLLLVAGFRKGELLTLPVDGLRSEVVNGVEKWYIRYWQKKSGKGKRLEENKRWLSPMGSELARKLWDEILSITEGAREAAVHLEVSEEKGRGVRIPWVDDDVQYLTTEDVDRAFGWSGASSTRAARMNAWGIESIPASTVECDVGRRKVVYRRHDVEEQLLEMRGPLLTHITGTNKKQKLSETLLIYFEDFLDPRKANSEILVRRMARSTLDKFLTGTSTTSPLAGDLSANTHGFRHWLNTVANKAGMSAFMIGVWMQRANIQHNLFYLHDPLDVADFAREGLRRRKLIGPGAEKIYSLEKEKREKQIDSIHLAHVASTVICTLDLTHAECPKEKFCEVCSFGMHDPENEHMRQRLEARLRMLESNLSRLERLKQKGQKIHEKQLRDAQAGILEIRRRLFFAASEPDVEMVEA